MHTGDTETSASLPTGSDCSRRQRIQPSGLGSLAKSLHHSSPYMSPRPPPLKIQAAALEQPLFTVHTAGGVEHGSWSSPARPATSVPASPVMRRPPSECSSSARSLTTSPMMMRSPSTAFIEAFEARKPPNFKPPFGQTACSTEREAQNYSLKSRFLAQEVLQSQASTHDTLPSPSLLLLAPPLLLRHALLPLTIHPPRSPLRATPRALAARPRARLPEWRRLPQPNIPQPNLHVSEYRRPLP